MKKRNELLKKLLLKKRNEVVEGLEAQMGRKLTRETGQKIDSAMDSADQSALRTWTRASITRFWR